MTIVSSDLPHDINLLKVYTDYLSYLFAHTRQYLNDYSGLDLWSEHGSKAKIVLTHPHGCGVIQQQFLQRAAIAAGLVPARAIQTRLVFLRESEASMSFCMAKNPTLAANLPVRHSQYNRSVTSDELHTERESVHRLRGKGFTGDCFRLQAARETWE
jgi:hypothetical protein